jgi:hypothetical protein
MPMPGVHPVLQPTPGDRRGRSEARGAGAADLVSLEVRSLLGTRALKNLICRSLDHGEKLT